LSDGTTYHYRIAASHPYGANHGDDMTFTTNAPPVFDGYALDTPYQTPVTVATADLLGMAGDPDGDAVAITAAGPSSANGGSVAMQSVAILYTPPNGFSGTDTFPVTISDNRGASVIGAVTVTVGPQPDGGVFGIHSTQVIPLADGKMGLKFQGVPGRVYQIQRSPDLITWSFVATVTAGPDGDASFTDESPPQPSAFYRLGLP
jgi:hypothetical protein